MELEKRRRGRPSKYPAYLIAQHDHSSRKFEAAHRMRLKTAYRALQEANRGCYFAPSVTEITYAMNAIRLAIEVTRPGKWVRE